MAYSTHPTTAVYVDSGSAGADRGDEYLAWYATPGDDDGEPTGESRECVSREAAIRVAETMARDEFGGVEVVVE